MPDIDDFEGKALADAVEYAMYVLSARGAATANEESTLDAVAAAIDGVFERSSDREAAISYYGVDGWIDAKASIRNDVYGRIVSILGEDALCGHGGQEVVPCLGR